MKIIDLIKENDAFRYCMVVAVVGGFILLNSRPPLGYEAVKGGMEAKKGAEQLIDRVVPGGGKTVEDVVKEGSKSLEDIMKKLKP